ncbi:tripartite tricarboxylate transporter TctB family protein [Bacillus sp. JCM 19041]|uniref:tripartite tricarboxylate transporter TctB family protein n=1 Tax=Bacillus sp. JCM 19041 TaxID=1460637 RepID=UPI0006D1BEE1
MDNSIRSDRLVSIVLVLISMIIFYISHNMNTLSILSIGVGSDFLPKLVAIGIFLTSVTLFAQTFFKQKQANAVHDSSVEKQSDTLTKASLLRVSLSVFLIISYVLLIPILGFIIASVLYLFTQSLALNKERKGHYHYVFLFASFVFAAVAIYALFRFGFNLMLPAGMLG